MFTSTPRIFLKLCQNCAYFSKKMLKLCFYLLCKNTLITTRMQQKGKVIGRHIQELKSLLVHLGLGWQGVVSGDDACCA